MPEQTGPGHAPDLTELSAYLDGELAAAQRRQLAAHLAVCATCAKQLAQFQALSGDFKALPDAVLGFDLAGVIAGRIAAAPRPPGTRPRLGWHVRWPVAIGAAASVAVGIFLGSLLVAGGDAAVAPPMAALSVVDTLPPGSLCIGLESCYAKGGVK